MKKFVLAFGIPVLAVASLIGSGYATWYFNNNVTGVNGTIGVNIEPKKVVGAKFEHVGDKFEDMKLVLDQTEPTKPDGGTADGMPGHRLSVHFAEGFSESLVADDGDTTNDTPTSEDKFVSGIRYKITTTITIPLKVAEYVDFTFKGQTSSDTSTTSLTLKKEYEYTTEEVHEKEFFTISHDTATSDVTVAYAKDQEGKSKEPSTPDEYEIMKTAVSGKTIDISFTAEIVK